MTFHGVEVPHVVEVCETVNGRLRSMSKRNIFFILSSVDFTTLNFI